MQTELEVLNAGMEDRNAQVLEANGARDFAEAEARSARTCLRELEKRFEEVDEAGDHSSEVVTAGHDQEESVSRAHPSSHAVKLFAVKEIEDDLTDLRTLLAHLCDEFTSMDPSKIKRLGRLQVQMDEVMDTMRLTATKLKAVRSFVK
ncbi:hypothetical protein RQP46_004755 [Phenoliferia psychrophenolica]